MTPRDIETIARTPHDAYNDRDLGRVSPLFAANATFIDMATGQAYHGPAGFRKWQENWAAAFPDSRIEITRIRSGDDFAVVEYTGRGTHTGALETMMGTIPPTNRHGEAPFCDIYEIQNGKIVTARTYYDSATLMRQLGLMPSSATAASPEREYAR
jgi:steroid delta-isomerase-like uncharacterized protein